MKKRILRVFLALTVFIQLLSLPVRADEAELYQNSGADTLMEALPEEAQSLLQNVGADPMETPAPDAATKLFSALSEGFRAEWTAPARALLTLLVSCVLCRLVQEFAAKELSYAVSVCGAAFHGGEHRDSTDLRRAVACSGKCRLGFEQRGAHPGFACVFGVFRGFCRDIV